MSKPPGWCLSDLASAPSTFPSSGYLMFYSGTQGQMFIDGVKAAKVRSWSFNSALVCWTPHLVIPIPINTRHPNQHWQLSAVLLRAC